MPISFTKLQGWNANRGLSILYFTQPNSTRLVNLNQDLEKFI